MTVDRTRPLLAYALVAFTCALVLAQGLRTGAVQDLISGAPEVTPGTELGAVHGTLLSARPAAPGAGQTVKPTVTPVVRVSHPAPVRTVSTAAAAKAVGHSAAKPHPVTSTSHPVAPATKQRPVQPTVVTPVKGKGHGHVKADDARSAAKDKGSGKTHLKGHVKAHAKAHGKGH